MKNAIITILILAVLLGGIKLFLSKSPSEPVPILEQPIVYKDLIQIDEPLKNEEVASPITISGKARGTWYFEASFPVEVRDEDGTVLFQGPVEASGEWMTTEYVPFSQSIAFTAPKGKFGTIIFHKDNPSGDPARDESVVVPIKFK
jgi:hypothetical protein